MGLLNHNFLTALVIQQQLVTPRLIN